MTSVQCRGGAAAAAFAIALAALLWVTVAPTTTAEAAAAEVQRDSTATLEWAGFERTYHVHVPPSYDGTQPAPLVLVLHFGLGNARIMQKLSRFDEVSDAEGFIVVYPEGYKTTWGGIGTNTPAQKEGTDDVGFISALIDAMKEKYQIQPERVHLVGMCNGGYLAQVLATQLPHKIASFATATATCADAFNANYSLKRPVAIMFINGTADKYVPYEGGVLPLTPDQSVWPTRQVVANWVQLNGCSSEPEVTDLPNRVDDGTSITREVWAQCEGDAEVVLYSVEGAGHTWPGGLQYQPEEMIGKTSRDMDASQVIWEFFERHPLPRTG
jgi:polyhydroxybutyrate depolymerase